MEKEAGEKWERWRKRQGRERVEVGEMVEWREATEWEEVKRRGKGENGGKGRKERRGKWREEMETKGRRGHFTEDFSQRKKLLRRGGSSYQD